MINIVLHEPEMPANTGNIGRTCVATGVRLHLIGPLGFQINDKMLKRAGLDYWDKLDVTEYDDYKDFLAKNPGAKVYMATTKAHKISIMYLIAFELAYANGKMDEAECSRYTKMLEEIPEVIEEAIALESKCQFAASCAWRKCRMTRCRKI